MPKFAVVNDVLQSAYYEIQEEDRIQVLNYYTVEQILTFLDIKPGDLGLIKVNHQNAELSEPVYENFSIDFEMPDIPTDKKTEVQKQNAESVETSEKTINTGITVQVNGKNILLSGKEKFVFVDVFEKIEFDLSRPRGKSVITKINGRNAEYMEELHGGEVIEIYWEEGTNE